ncbi:hypothetical protein GUJ93_ZPchr0008g11504 [Zizania palustris]|uniref:Uncharacterized protein n=1 Tax=Zizania palustris TaxID=103762 RepID=A0A8J5VI59_ZIZPA|nr:hypothetical protein GUJ93_ZPchr0008g11504 [Zizania palustris]
MFFQHEDEKCTWHTTVATRTYQRAARKWPHIPKNGAEGEEEHASGEGRSVYLLTLGIGKETKEPRPRVENGREEVAKGTRITEEAKERRIDADGPGAAWRSSEIGEASGTVREREIGDGGERRCKRGQQ